MPLEILRSYSGDLQSRQSILSAKERYNVQRWKDAFVSAESASAQCFHDDDVYWMVTTHPTSFTRQEILDIAEGTEPDLTKYRRMFVASMAWGRGTRARFPWFSKTRIGFRDRIAALLRDAEFDGCLQRCVDHLQKRDVKLAYQEWSEAKFPGIGSAFFTKTLYFLGRSLGDHWDYPLVLDSRVSEALAYLTGYRQLVALGTNYQPANDAVETYPRYVCKVHGWASSLASHGECLERLLFDLVDKKAKGQLESRCQRAYA